MNNTFDLDKFNNAAFRSLIDEKSFDIAEDSFKMMGKFSWDHGHLPDYVFERSSGGINKAEWLGIVIDEMSDQILTGDEE
jgi:hypothetical protein